MILEFSMKLPSTSNKLRQIILDYENLPMFLPDQLKKIKILEQNETEIITEETFLFSSVFKKTIVQKSLHKILSDNHLHTDVIEGIAKGSKIDIFFSDIDHVQSCPDTVCSKPGWFCNSPDDTFRHCRTCRPARFQ